MRKLLVSCAVSVGLVVLLAGCGNPPTPQPTAAQTTPAAEQPTSAPGTASISGRVVDKERQQPIANTAIYLAPVYWDPEHKNAAFALDVARSPAGFTDEQGNFSFTNVPPSEYVLFVGDAFGTNDIVLGSDGKAVLYQLEAEKNIDAGTVQVRPDVSPGR